MKQITACIDASPGAMAVVDAASWVSQRLQQPLTLLHTLEKVDKNAADLSGSIGFGSREHLLEQLTELDAQRAKLAIESSRIMLESAEKRAKEHGAQDCSVQQRHGLRLSSGVNFQTILPT